MSRTESPATDLLPRRLGSPLAVVLSAVLGVVLVLSGPARALGAPPDPVGVWPLDPVPEVVTGFDAPSSPWGAGHRGVDLLGTVGSPVRAALAGRITFAGRLAGRGVVVVDHGETRTTYEPVSATVEVGTRVRAGATIGVLELAGSHCFPRACLHWGWLRGTTYLDPLLLVGAGPVRLLPLWRQEPIGLSPVRSLAPPVARWAPPLPPYAAWRPPIAALPGAQARGCACW